jgi:hypothetical protein
MARLARRFVTRIVLACGLTVAMASATWSYGDAMMASGGASSVLAAAQSDHGDRVGAIRCQHWRGCRVHR